MTILPGSLDYLYTNGVIDHVPYEAYQYPITGNAYGTTYNMQFNPYRGVKSQVLGQEDYIQRAKQGRLFNSFSDDIYVKAPVYDDYDNSAKSYREQILDAASNAKRTVTTAPSIVKGILATAILVGTPLMLICCRKKPLVKMPSTSHGSKWNLLNWFKK